MTVAVVTGASRGLGRALAMRLFADGAIVVAVARTLAAPPPPTATSGRWEARRADLGDARAVDRLVQQVLDATGPPDVLINAAAIGVYGSVLDADPPAMARLTAVNLLAPVRLCGSFVPAMRERDHGLVINVSSLAACGPIRGHGLYGACKAALDAYSAALRAELAGSGVRVLLARPGRMQTGFFAAAGYPAELVAAADRFPAPEPVAAEILEAARKGRAVYVVAADRRLLAMRRLLPPGLADRVWHRATHPATVP
jgi:short-subunit dehydrogenase